MLLINSGQRKVSPRPGSGGTGGERALCQEAEAVGGAGMGDRLLGWPGCGWVEGNVREGAA